MTVLDGSRRLRATRQTLGFAHMLACSGNRIPVDLVNAKTRSNSMSGGVITHRGRKVGFIFSSVLFLFGIATIGLGSRSIFRLGFTFHASFLIIDGLIVIMLSLILMMIIYALPTR